MNRRIPPLCVSACAACRSDGSRSPTIGARPRQRAGPPLTARRLRQLVQAALHTAVPRHRNSCVRAVPLQAAPFPSGRAAQPLAPTVHWCRIQVRLHSWRSTAAPSEVAPTDRTSRSLWVRTQYPAWAFPLWWPESPRACAWLRMRGNAPAHLSARAAAALRSPARRGLCDAWLQALRPTRANRRCPVRVPCARFRRAAPAAPWCRSAESVVQFFPQCGRRFAPQRRRPPPVCLDTGAR